MTQPNPYVPAYDFSAFQALSPADPLPADKLDIELVSIQTAIQQLVTNIGFVQRDDLALKNLIVTPESLSAATLNLMALTSYTIQGNWVTATAYNPSDVVTESSSTYVCAEAHTSGVFATDLAAAKWVAIASTSASESGSFNVTGGTPPENGIYLSAANVLGLAARSLKAVEVTAEASSVNYLRLNATATGVAPRIEAKGSDTNVSLALWSQGTSPITLHTNAGAQIQFSISHTASAVNYFRTTGAITGSGPLMQVVGSDTNIDALWEAKGSGSHKFYNDAGALLALEIGYVASADNYLKIIPGSSVSDVIFSLLGTSTNVSMEVQGKGNGGLILGVTNADFGLGGGPSNMRPLIIGPLAIDTNDGTTGWAGATISLPAGVGNQSFNGSVGLQFVKGTLGSNASVTNASGIDITGLAISGNVSASNVYGVYVRADSVSGSSASFSNSIGFRVDMLTAASAASITSAFGFYAKPPVLVGASGMTNSYPLYVPTISLTGGSTLTNSYGLYVSNISASGVTTGSGIFIAAQSGGTTNNAINYNNLFVVDEKGFTRDGGRSRCTTQFDATSGDTGATLTDVVGMTATVLAAGVYRIRAALSTVSTTNSGIKVAIGGTATATAFSCTTFNYNTATINAVDTVTTIGNAMGAATAVATDVLVEGYITVNAAGTLTLQAAQNASHADTTSVKVGSTLFIERVA